MLSERRSTVTRGTTSDSSASREAAGGTNDRYGVAGRGRRAAASTVVKRSAGTHLVVACSRGLATVASQCSTWAFRSASLTKDRPYRKLSRR